MLLLPEEQRGDIWEISIKQRFLGSRVGLDRNAISHFLVLQKVLPTYLCKDLGSILDPCMWDFSWANRHFI